MPEVAPRARPPLTVTAKALVEGSGQHERFRALVADLLRIADGIAAVRDDLGAQLGTSGAGYSVLMAIAQAPRAEGVSVGEVARHLRVTGAFVTMETGKLARAGLVHKRTNPADRRGVLLRLSAEGRRRILALLPRVRAFNDDLFGPITREDFAVLCRLAADLGARFAAVVPRVTAARERRAA
jgi:DNA-binding MarR family transcriptional regulator